MSSAKMRVLRPKLEEATKQYDKPEDQMMKQQAMMAMYSKYGVSPLSGCLPMLIQMPIWIAMFNFVPNAIQLRGESFLWISDLSTYDPIIEWNKNIWLIGDHLSLTCILFCVANVLYSIMSMRQQRDQMVGQQAEQMKMMQWMMYLMPVMFFHIQRLLCRAQLLLLHLAVLQRRHNVDTAQDHRRREAACHTRGALQGKPEQPQENQRAGRTTRGNAATGRRNEADARTGPQEIKAYIIIT